MKKLLVLCFVFMLVSCSKESKEETKLITEKELSQQKIESVFGTNSAQRIASFKPILLPIETSAYLTEKEAEVKSNGIKTFIYIIHNQTDNVEPNVAAPGGCGSVTGGWILHNDGCFYHGTLYTGCNGISIFVEDPNPYTDGYIGNEPRCGNGNIA